MDNLIYTYTLDQAIEDGQIAKLSSEFYATNGVMALQGIGFDSKADDYMFIPKLIDAAKEELALMPAVCTDGGNDKDFFTFTWRGTKFFAIRNEVLAITIMLPSEY
jgi:hypothetical protein